MVTEDIEELQDQDTWDFERAERRPGRKGGRAVVSVAFGADEFDAVSGAAESLGMKLSAFIRAAALGHARAQTSTGHVVSATGSLGVRLPTVHDNPRVQTSHLRSARMPGPR